MLEIQIICLLFFVLSTVSLPAFGSREKNQIGYFPIHTVPHSKLSKQRCDATTITVTVYSIPLKAGESIDTNLCYERPKLLQKLLGKFNLAIFRLRLRLSLLFMCCRHVEIGANVSERANA